jgi:uncharacterized coiled-coil DUF342 family protein
MNTERNNKQFMKVIMTVFMVSALIIMGNACKTKTTQNKDEISQEDVAGKLGEAADTTAAYLSDEYRERVESYKSKIENAEMQIKEMKEKIKSAETDVRQDYQNKVQMLESQLTDVKQNLNDLVKASDRSWEDLSAGLDSAMVDLDQAIMEAKDEFQGS